MLYVGLCRDSYPGGDVLYVVDDIDCMPAGLLSFPELGKTEGEAPIKAAQEYIEEWDLVDVQSPPLHITVNTSSMFWEGQAFINGDKLKLVDAYEEESDG
jgi:hypothetical protein